MELTVNYDVGDICQGFSEIDCQLGVISNEPADATNPDWVIIDAHYLKLRAERLGSGGGRIYTIICRDRRRNTAQNS